MLKELGLFKGKRKKLLNKQDFKGGSEYFIFLMAQEGK